MESEKEFLDIVSHLAADEANDFLDKRLILVDKWMEIQAENGARIDLQAFIQKLLSEDSQRGPTVVCLAAALWRLKEMERANGR